MINNRDLLECEIRRIDSMLRKLRPVLAQMNMARDLIILEIDNLNEERDAILAMAKHQTTNRVQATPPTYPTEQRGGVNDASAADSPQCGTSASGYSAKHAGQGGVP